MAVPFGAEGTEVMFPEVVLLFAREEFEAKDVVNRPPKYIDEPFWLGWIVLTGPFKPPNGTDVHEDEPTFHSPTLSPDPLGAVKFPPAHI